MRTVHSASYGQAQVAVRTPVSGASFPGHDDPIGPHPGHHHPATARCESSCRHPSSRLGRSIAAVNDDDRQDALDVLGDALHWQLPTFRWRGVGEAVRTMAEALAHDDVAAFRRAALGALALWASLLVLRAAVPQRWWSRALVWLASGLVGATAAWVTVSAVVAAPDDEATTRLWAVAGFAAGFVVAALANAVRTIRRRR